MYIKVSQFRIMDGGSELSTKVVVHSWYQTDDGDNRSPCVLHDNDFGDWLYKSWLVANPDLCAS